ncbi:MAG: DUF2809 domain-containing protein [Bacteroidota bacterium]|nr:DUF2809 domain-containing protein [Bacteroidota bacterium]
MLHFSKRYFLLASGLLLTEIIIARYAHDQIIRPYGGDVLATIFLYCLGRSLVAARPARMLVAVLLISYLMEGLQYINLLGYLGWQQWRLARIVLGSHFSGGDMLAYSLGALVVMAAEWWCRTTSAAVRRPAVG